MGRPAILLGAVLVVALCVVAAHYMIVTGQAPPGTEAIAAPPLSQPGTDAPSTTQQATQTGPTAEVTPEAAREIAARLLGCEPAALKLAPRQPEPKTYAWGRIAEVAWTGHCALGDFPAADLEIRVDRVAAYVRRIQWKYPAAPPASSADGERTTADEAASLARQFFTKHAGLPVAGADVKVRTNGSGADAHLFCEVGGAYPDGGRYLATLDFEAQGGRPYWYSCVIFPPDPPAISPVRLTEADAVKAAEAAAIAMGNLIPVRSEVVRLTTASNYAARGVPVYEVDLRMEVVTPGRDDRRAVCRHAWGVNATTGEVVTTVDLEKLRTTGTTPTPEK